MVSGVFQECHETRTIFVSRDVPRVVANGQSIESNPKINGPGGERSNDGSYRVGAIHESHDESMVMMCQLNSHGHAVIMGPPC